MDHAAHCLHRFIESLALNQGIEQYSGLFPQ